MKWWPDFAAMVGLTWTAADGMPRRNAGGWRDRVFVFASRAL
ncbi:hypothetical protein [Alicyclobacillus acidoterrestris]|nr:hypothetical protein [Alicyclobacillus acidoterrestris]